MVAPVDKLTKRSIGSGPHVDPKLGWDREFKKRVVEYLRNHTDEDAVVYFQNYKLDSETCRRWRDYHIALKKPVLLRPRRGFDKFTKLSAVQYAHDYGTRQAAHRFSIPIETLRRWLSTSSQPTKVPVAAKKEPTPAPAPARGKVSVTYNGVTLEAESIETIATLIKKLS